MCVGSTRKKGPTIVERDADKTQNEEKRAYVPGQWRSQGVGNGAKTAICTR